MFISSFKTEAQAFSQVPTKSLKRANPLPTIDPILISCAASVTRSRLRYQKRLDALALVSVIAFAIHSKQVIRNHPPVEDGYIYHNDGDGVVIYTPEEYYEHMVRYTVSRLNVILE
jgi:hypothetical protein